MSNENNEKDLNVEVDTSENQENGEKPTKGFFGRIKGVAQAGVDLTKRGINRATEYVEDAREERLRIKNYQEMFIAKTYSFQIKGNLDSKGNPKEFRAFRNNEDFEIYIPTSEENSSSIYSKSILYNIEDKSEISITFIELKDVKPVKLVVDEQHKYNIECFVAKFEYMKKPIVQTVTNISNVVDQSITIEGDNKGDVSQVSNIETELDVFFNEIQNIKTKKLSKEKRAQTEAIKIIGPVKDSILNKKEDKSLINKFKDLLIIFAPAFLETFLNFLN